MEKQDGHEAPSTESQLGGTWSSCAGSGEVELLMKELTRQMQKEQQQLVAAASCAAAAEALPLAKEKLGNMTVRPSTLMVVRHPVAEVVLVPATAPVKSAASPAGDAADAVAIRAPGDAIGEIVGNCIGSNSSMNNTNGSTSSSNRVELLDVSVKDKHLENRLLCACPELRRLLGRGLTVLEFTDMARQRQQEQQHRTLEQREQHAQVQSPYVLVRRGLPKFFDLDWESLACYFLQALSQQQQQQQQVKQGKQQQQQEQQQEQQQKQERRLVEHPNRQLPEVKTGMKDQQQQQKCRVINPVQPARRPVEQNQQGQMGKQPQKEKKGAAVCNAFAVCKGKSDEVLLWAHQLSRSLLQCFASPSMSNDAASSNSSNGSSCSRSISGGMVEVWALEKLNGEAAHISFCSQLKAWACCSKNVCLLLPAGAAVASSCKYTMPGMSASRDDAALRDSSHQQRLAAGVLQGPSHLQEQRTSRKQQQQAQRQAFKLLRPLGLDRFVSHTVPPKGQKQPYREQYALRVADAWQRLLKHLTEEQVEKLQSLLQSNTLVGELIGTEERQHIVRASTRQPHLQQQEQKQHFEQEEQRQEHEETQTGRLTFFALVPHKSDSVNTPFCGPPCRSPGVALPLLESLGLETARVAARLQASSPIELLLQLRQLEHEKDSPSPFETEGLVLYFCRCKSSVGNERDNSSSGGSNSIASSNTMSGDSCSQEESVVVALAKAKTTFYQMRRKIRERMKRLIQSCCFWEAAAAAASAAACPAEQPSDAKGKQIFADFVLEALDVPSKAASAAAYANGSEAELTADISADATSPEAEASRRVQMAQTVGMYWCSALEGELSRFCDMLKSFVPQRTLRPLLKEIVNRQSVRKEAKVLLRQLVLHKQELDRLVQTENSSFRKAVAFSCSLAASLLLALRCLPDPQHVSLLWQEHQSPQPPLLQQQQQGRVGECSGRGAELHKDLQDIGYLRDLICVPATRKKRDTGAPLIQFLMAYVDMRFLDFMEDSREFGEVMDMPHIWRAPTQKLLLTHMQRVNSSSGRRVRHPFVIVRMADLNGAGAAVLTPKHWQHVQKNKPRLNQQRATAYLVVPPLLLTAYQFYELRQVCLDHGCRLLLRHRACAAGCCCCSLHDSRSNCPGGAREAVTVSAATADSASLVVLWGLDEHGSCVSSERLHQLQQLQTHEQLREHNHSWRGIALVNQSGAIEGLYDFGFEGGLGNASSQGATRYLVAETAVGKAILQAGGRVAEGILALASKCCNRNMLDTKCGGSQAPLRPEAATSDPRRTIVKLPALLVAKGTGVQERGIWQRAVEQFAAAVKAVMHNTGYGSDPRAYNKTGTLGPPPAAVFSSESPYSGTGFVRDSCQGMTTSADSAGLPSPPSPAASVVVLLPVGLPGSGKTTVMLEALRPALRHEFMSRNTVSVGGVTGLVIWEGRPPNSLKKMRAATTTAFATTPGAAVTTAATSAVASSSATGMSTRASATATPTVTAGAPVALSAPFESVFDCVCFLSSDEFTGEVLRSLGHNTPTGLLHQLCLEEALRAGPAAAARLSSPRVHRDSGGPFALYPDDKTMNVAISEGKKLLENALNDFFVQLTDTLVNRFLQEEQRRQPAKEGSSPAECWSPLRVLVVVDRNHPPNAITSRFSEVEKLLRDLQWAVLTRCGVLVKVATAALLLLPDAAQDRSSVLFRLPSGCSNAHISWNFPWSIEVVLICMYRVLCRGAHATLTGGRGGLHAPFEGLSDVASDPDIEQDVKALHICFSFLSLFRGLPNVHDFLRRNSNVTHVLQLQTMLTTQQQQKKVLQPVHQQLEKQQQLLLTALSSLKPFRDPAKNQRVLYTALAESLRQFPPEGPVSGEHHANQLATIGHRANELLQHIDSVFLSMEEPLLQQSHQMVEHQLQRQQPQRQNEPQEQRHHDKVAPCVRLQQPQGDSGQVATEESGRMEFKGLDPPTVDLKLRLPKYFSVFLGGEKEALTSLTQQLLVSAQNAGGAGVPSVVDICENLKPVDKFHTTTFFLGGDTLRASRREIEAANEWLDGQLGATSHDVSCRDAASKDPCSYSCVSPRILRLYELLASRRQLNHYFKFRVTHLLLTDIGLACAALTPLSPVLPLAEPSRPRTSAIQVSIGSSTLLGDSLSGDQVDGPVSLELAKTAREVDAGVGQCGPSCAVCGPHEVPRQASGLQPLCMAAYHYAHVTLGLSGGATAVMSNDTIAAADKAILQGIREKKLRANTPRPFRTGSARNAVGVPEDRGKPPVAKDAYHNLQCCPVGGSDDPQELMFFTGVPIGNRCARLWVWSVPTEVQEEVEGPVQAC
ncbi:hypothetical protein, conserved [Eimeria maxima]|uniref:Uncharacterized protein n=1 Tax=Eimeria maxima TaxID=5804 RepID=U6MGI4_EIMMA|nr:hypothetical protein, conserved [Eimeria maxima]CDJ61554.1 hypothetical protein, conserved [Eimeria maxima]